MHLTDASEKRHRTGAAMKKNPPILASATIWEARFSAAISSAIPDPLFMVGWLLVLFG
jgi:hypothetical protein